MKNTKLSHIIIIVLSLAVLVGAMVGFTASAADSEYTNEIVSMNIAYGDTIQVLIALDTPVDNQEGITVKYINPNGEERTATYWKTMDVKGTDRPVWYTDGISAKDLGQDVVATVYVDGEAISTANISVAHYLYTKLYKEGYINAESKLDLHKKALYQNLLAYAASAETVLWNDKTENESNQRVLITEKMFVYAKDGTVDTGKTTDSDVLTKNEEFTLTYNGTAPDGYEFTGVWLSSVDGTSVIKDGVATKPTVHGVYEPVFNATTHNAGKYYASATDGTRYDFDTKLNLSGDNQADLSVYNVETNPNGILANPLSPNDGYASLITDKLSTLDNSTGELVFNMTSTDWTGFNLANKVDNVGSAGSKYIAEFDFTYIDSAAYTGSGSSDSVAFYIGPTSYNENSTYMHSITHAKFEADREVMMFGNVPVVKGETYTIRIETDVDGNYALYVNDVLAADEPAYYTNETQIPADYDEYLYAGFGFAVRQRHAGDSFSFAIDNFYMGTIDSYYEDKTIDGIRLDFSDESDLKNLTYNYSATINKPTASITDGVMYCNPTANWNGFAVESGDTSTYSSGIYVFEADINYMEVTNCHNDGTNVFMGFQDADYDGISNDKCFEMGRITVDSTKTKYNIMNNKNAFTEDEYVLEIGTTYKMRFEYDTTTGITSIYINGVLVDQNVADNGVAANANSINGVKTDKGNPNNKFGDFIFIWRRYGKISFDNIYYGIINGVVAE